MAIRIQEVSNRSSRGNVAIRAHKVTEGRVQGGPAIPIIKITDADLIANGGEYKVAGNSAVEFLVYEVTGELAYGGPAIPVYIVNDSGGGSLTPPYNLVAVEV